MHEKLGSVEKKTEKFFFYFFLNFPFLGSVGIPETEEKNRVALSSQGAAYLLRDGETKRRNMRKVIS